MAVIGFHFHHTYLICLLNLDYYKQKSHPVGKGDPCTGVQVKRFHQDLYPRRFNLIMDHKPLTAIFDSKKGIPTLAASWLQWWGILSAYNYNMFIKPTQLHSNAVALSRLPLTVPIFSQNFWCGHCGHIQCSTSPSTTNDLTASSVGNLMRSTTYL